MRRIACSRHLLAGVLLVAVAAGCAGQDPTAGQSPASSADPTSTAGELNVQAKASYDLAATGEAERFMAGVVTPGNKVLVGGTVDLDFAFLGAESADGPPQPGPSAQASFLAVPRKAPSDPLEQPTPMAPADAVGVYETQVAFDRPGFWQVTVTAEVAGGQTMTGTGAFNVFEEHLVPQAGDAAPDITNLTMDDAGDVPKAAIDSRASSDGGPIDGAIPDPILHRTTVSQALDQQRPFVIVFSTPTYCQSQFCGPVTQAVAGLAEQYGDRAAFIHVEVWRDYEATTLNDAFNAWVNKGNEGREPWLFAVGADGVIDQRFDNVPDMQAVESWLGQLPAA